jgi:crotonobetainyl-CoA:carnitine CoA-transferase CaiB-like acyl-CoA transferase
VSTAQPVRVARLWHARGDQTRGMPAGNGANFHFFLRLARGSDVVIDNFAYGAVEGLGLGYDVLSRENPRIIYMALQGFLPGPHEARPFLDELAQMSAGLAFMTGPRGQPMRAGASIVDVGAAAYGIMAVLAALHQRAHTGRGQKITSGLFETTVFWVGQAEVGRESGEVPGAGEGRRDGVTVLPASMRAERTDDAIASRTSPRTRTFAKRPRRGR